MNVNTFVANTRLLFNGLLKPRIVLGNQSADLDSIVSAISMSFYLTSVNKRDFIPVINSTKEILKSKQECMYLFNYFSIDLDDLVFLSECKPKEIAEVVLVDHNELDEVEKAMDISKLVTAVIDHHLDKQLFPGANPRIVETVGSNTSHIGKLFQQQSETELSQSFASMMLFPILSDTSNYTSRNCQKDSEVGEYLTNISGLDCNQIYKEIEEAKFNQSHLDTNTLLKLDYKQYESEGVPLKWGMSSVTLSINEFIHRQISPVGEIQAFMNEKGLYFFGMLSIYKKDGEFRRDLALFARSKNLVSSFNSSDELDFLENQSRGDDLFYSIFEVKDVKKTRKYWQPVLENFLIKSA